MTQQKKCPQAPLFNIYYTTDYQYEKDGWRKTKQAETLDEHQPVYKIWIDSVVNVLHRKITTQ